MNRFRSNIWTDIDLVDEARQLLARDDVVLQVRTDATLEGTEIADAMIVGSRLAGTAELFAKTPRLQVLARCGIGYDRIDLGAATAAGVCAVNTPDGPTESTAEFTIALMLMVARRMQPAIMGMSAGKWMQGPSIIGFDLAGKRLGLVGCGRIGRRVAELALALRMEVQAFDPPAPTLPGGVSRVPSLPALLESSDVISLHVPSTPATRHLLGAAELSLCRPTAILINTARGPLVDEVALLDALRNRRLGGAGLDVWEPEPPAMDHPLLACPEVVATPHMAGFTREGRRRSHAMAVTQVLQVLRGELPTHLLNPEVWPHRRMGAEPV